jgi:hypothetical protein
MAALHMREHIKPGVSLPEEDIPSDRICRWVIKRMYHFHRQIGNIHVTHGLLLKSAVRHWQSCKSIHARKDSDNKCKTMMSSSGRETPYILLLTTPSTDSVAC